MVAFILYPYLYLNSSQALHDDTFNAKREGDADKPQHQVTETHHTGNVINGNNVS